MSNTCARCETHVANGRTYCDAHYLEVIHEYDQEYANYEILLQQYYIHLENWNEMSIEEQDACHDAADTDQLGSIAIWVGLALGALFWSWKSSEIEWWLGAGIVGFTTFVFWMGKKLFSRIIRGAWMGIIYAFGFLTIGLGLHYLADFFDIHILQKINKFTGASNEETIAYSILIFASSGLIMGIWREASGGNHAYGGPLEPSAPIRPTP